MIVSQKWALLWTLQANPPSPLTPYHVDMFKSPIWSTLHIFSIMWSPKVDISENYKILQTIMLYDDSSNPKLADMVSPAYHVDMYKWPILGPLSTISMEFDETRWSYPWNSTQTYSRLILEHWFITLWLKPGSEANNQWGVKILLHDSCCLWTLYLTQHYLTTVTPTNLNANRCNQNRYSLILEHGIKIFNWTYFSDHNLV